MNTAKSLLVISTLLLLWSTNLSSQIFCADAQPLSCGSTTGYSAPADNELDASNYNYGACSSSLHSYDGNERLFYVDVGSAYVDLTISILGLAEDMDLFIFKNCSSYPGPLQLTNCYGSSTNAGAADETLTVSFAKGEYFFVVDGVSAGVTSSFTVDIVCTTPGGGGPPSNCTASATLSCGDYTYVPNSGNNSFDISNYDFSSCTHASYNYEGIDHVFDINAGYTPTTLTITMSGLNDDMDMFLFESCTSAGVVSFSQCVGISYNSGFSQETIVVYNASGTYKLVVDGFASGVSSAFNLQVSCSAPPPPPPPTGCTYATSLYCGESRWVYAPTSNNYSGSNYDLSHCYGSALGYSGKDHLYKIDVGYDYKQLVINLSGLSADMDVFLFGSCENHYGTIELSHCKGSSTNSSTYDEQIILENASGVYYIAVDSYDPWYSSGYEISVNCNAYAVDPCHYATPLFCGDYKWVNAPSHNNLQNYDLSGCSGYGYNSYSGKDHLYKIEIGGAHRDITIRATGLSADMDLLLFRYCENHYGAGTLISCQAKSVNSGTYSEEINLYDASGTYYLAVDSQDPWYSSGYQLSLDCIDPTPPDPCTYATPLYCGESNWIYAPNFNNYDNYNLAGCSSYNYGYTGKDHLYKIDAGYANKNLTIRMSGLTADMDLLLFKWCENHYGLGELVQCVDVSRNSGTYNEEITIYDANGIYYLSVDSEDPWYSSGYELSLECVEPVISPCHYATHLYCGDTKWINAPTTNSYNSSHYDFSECYGHGSAEYNGFDHLYIVDAGYEGGDLHIEISNMSADLDLFVYQTCADGYGHEVLRNCAGYSDNYGFASEEIIINNASGHYYVVVESYDQWYSSGYEISIKCNQHPSYYCDDAEEMYCGDSKWVSASYANHFDSDNYIFSDCGYVTDSYTGFDHFYKIDVGYDPVKLTIELTNMIEDLDLLVFNSCSSLYEEIRLGNCLELSKQDGSYSESVEIENASGTYYFVVDAKSTYYSSDYKISTTCHHYSPPPPDDPPGDDPPGDDTPGDDTPGDDPDDTLNCGETIYSSTVDLESDFANEDIVECFETSLLYTGPDVLIPFEKKNDEDVIEIIMVQANANLSLFILDEDLNFVGEACKGSNFNASKQLENASSVGEVYSDNGILSSGNYYALIEGYGRNIESDFSISMSCSQSCTTSDTLYCESALMDVSTVDLAHSQSRYDTESGDSFVGYSGPEWSSLLIIEDAATITIDMYDIISEGDMDLFLLDSCNSDIVLAYSIGNSTEEEQIVISLEAGTYTIVVDGWLGASGSFNIEISGCGDTTGALVEPIAESRSGRKLNHSFGHHVMPNPFTGTTRLNINSAKATSGELELYTIDGKQIWSGQIQLNQGLNEMILDDEFGGINGLILYRIITAENRVQGTMIRVK